MKEINPAHIAALTALINGSPYFSLLSLRVCSITHGASMLEVTLGEKHLNPFGGPHGGVYASAVESAAYWAAYCGVGEETGLVTLDLRADNLSGASRGTLIAEGRLIKQGKTICLAEATVIDAQGKLLAHGASKLLVTDGLQTIRQAVAAMGHAPLPPKFL